VPSKHKIAIFSKTAQTILMKFRYCKELHRARPGLQVHVGTALSLYRFSFPVPANSDKMSEPASATPTELSALKRIGDTHLPRLTGPQCYQSYCGVQVNI
jgi:hypothetical protein